MIGIDIVQISRIERAAQKPAFLNHVYTRAEIEYYRSNGKNAETLAGMYALKEAAAKALGTGFAGFGLKDVEVTHDPSGAPRVEFRGRALGVFKGIGGADGADASVECSISHERKYAVAVCMITIHNSQCTMHS